MDNFHMSDVQRSCSSTQVSFSCTTFIANRIFIRRM